MAKKKTLKNGDIVYTMPVNDATAKGGVIGILIGIGGAIVLGALLTSGVDPNLIANVIFVGLGIFIVASFIHVLTH